MLASALLASSALAGCGRRVPSDTGATYQAVLLSPTRNAVYVFDLLTNRIRYRLDSGMVPFDLALGEGGLIFVSHAQENSFTVFLRNDPWTWYSIGKVGTPDQPGRLVYGDAHQELYVASATASRLGVYRMTGQRRPLLQQTLRLDENLGQPAAIGLSGDGNTVYVAGKVLQSLSRADERLSPGQTLALPERSEISDMSIAGNLIFLADKAQDQILVVDATTFKQTATIPLGAGLASPVLPTRMTLNHAGTKIYLSGAGASVVQVLDAKTPKLLSTLHLDTAKNPAGSPFGLALSGNDRQLYVTAQSGRNLALIDANPVADQPDSLKRTIGTAVSEALIPPLGDIAIF